MEKKFSVASLSSWVFSIIIFAIGVLNLLWVHPVPGMVYMLLSLLFFSPLNNFFKNKVGLVIPTKVKFILGVFLIWFTLGPSDLGDIIDYWSR